MSKNRPARHTGAQAVDRPLGDGDIRTLLAPLNAALPLAIAVSGGPDSLALMRFAADHLPHDRLHILTVDHGLRTASAGEAKFVGEQAHALGLQHTVLHWRGNKPETGVQEAARAARYGLMADWCRRNGYRHLATAHNLDDQAETVLMRLARGSGVDGLAAMAPQSVRLGITLLRPLLDISHETLVAYLEASDAPYIQDPSNQDERFERVRVRKARSARDALGLDDAALAQTARRMGRAVRALEAYADAHVAQNVNWSAYGAAEIDRPGFFETQEETLLRAMAKVLCIVGGGQWPMQDHQLYGMLESLGGDDPKGVTLGGCRIVPRGDGMLVTRELNRISQVRFDFAEGDRFLWDGRFEVLCDDPGLGQVMIGPLGEKGWAALKGDKPQIPALIGQTLPSVCRENARECLVIAGAYTADVLQKHGLSARFVNPFA